MKVNFFNQPYLLYEYSIYNEKRLIVLRKTGKVDKPVAGYGIVLTNLLEDK